VVVAAAGPTALGALVAGAPHAAPPPVGERASAAADGVM
jgi:hypothetical protein